jgi:hypothetical protein
MGGLAAVALMEFGPATVDRALSMTGIGLQLGPQPPQISTAQRKGDRLDHPRTGGPNPPDITTVELVGLRQTAIVYRDRDGRELFRTDPLRNVTIVAKGLVLPSVTVRERGDSLVTPLPIPVAPSALPPRKPAGPVFGCESSFSPVAAPSMAHHTGRCMALLGRGVMIAQAD